MLDLCDMPEAKPAFEYIDGQLCQKMSPRFSHARLQATLAALLTSWARGRGRVGTEWRFVLEGLPGGRAIVVPDVAYLSYDRLPFEAHDAAEQPRMAPDLAVEVLSPDDRPALVARKIELYLAAGCGAVFVVDPWQRSIAVHDRAGSRVFGAGARSEHATVPGFTIDVDRLFAVLDEP